VDRPGASHQPPGVGEWMASWGKGWIPTTEKKCQGMKFFTDEAKGCQNFFGYPSSFRWEG